MVATRRTAPTAADAEMPDPELALKKKPVRKAMVKETTSKAKSTRARKAEVPAVEDAPRVIEEAPKPRATRGRPKKTVADVAEPELQPEQVESVRPAKATRSTKAGSVRGKKVAVAVEDAPALPAPEEAKPAKRTRANTSKAAPLSPKKITQVAKPPTRAAKAANAKPAAKAANATGSVRGRNTRGRKVSDENAEVPELAQPGVEDDSVIVVSSTPVEKPATRGRAGKKQQVDESEISMSTRETTPAASPVPHQHDDAEEDNEEPSAELSTPGKQDETVEDDDSNDELCGPKTPMRRGSPGAAARYHFSVQRTIRKHNEEQRLETPARRYAALGSQRGTPQTQKPYCRPVAPSSGVRPMTVARGANRSFVFRDLREGTSELRPGQEEQETMAETEDLSFIPDENIIAVDEEEDAQLTTPGAPAPLQLASPPTSLTDIESGVDDAESADTDSAMDVPMMDHSVENGDAEVSDATIVTQEQDDELERRPIASFETEDTVIINRPMHAEDGDVAMPVDDDESENSVVHHELATSPTPETMIWENVQPEQTIAVDFDNHLSDARTLPEPEPTERLDIASVLNAHLELRGSAVAGADENHCAAEDVAEEDAAETEPAEPTPAMDLNEYFDITALAEPTRTLDLAAQASVGEWMEVDGAPRSSEAEDKLSDALIQQEIGEQVSQHESSAVDNEEIVVFVPQSAPVQDSELPHYARSTLAFDVRRKSLPSTSISIPVRVGTRPNTSDGVSMPRVAAPFGQAWWTRSRANSNAAASRPATSHGVSTPCQGSAERYPVFAPRDNYVDHSQTVAASRFRDVSEKRTTRRQTFHRAIPGKTQEVSASAETSMSTLATPVKSGKERYPALGSRSTYVEHSQTAAPTTRFRHPDAKPEDRRKTFHKAISGNAQPAPAQEEPASSSPVATPRARYPALESRSNYLDHAKTTAPPARFQDPASKPLNRRQTFHRALSGKHADKDNIASTPVQVPVEEAATAEPQQTPTDRYPRLRPRAEYQDHAKTVAAPRFHTPAKKNPAKRAATTQKPTSMRKVALRNSSTPIKTPLKAAAMTPGQEPLTPHPAAPLRGVLALVEVYTLEGASASSPFTALLHRLGAKTTRIWSDRITHVVFKDGSPTTLQRVRLHNKDVCAASAAGTGNLIFCVNSRWVSDCDSSGTREDETDEAYAVDIEEIPRGGKRRRKSMEPSALMNLGGNVVRDRKASLGHSSWGRSSTRPSESPAKRAKLDDAADASLGAEKENTSDDDEDPATPAWIAEPDKLVQQTAPLKRVRKLDLPGKGSRRLTFWDGGN